MMVVVQVVREGELARKLFVTYFADTRSIVVLRVSITIYLEVHVLHTLTYVSISPKTYTHQTNHMLNRGSERKRWNRKALESPSHPWRSGNISGSARGV